MRAAMPRREFLAAAAVGATAGAATLGFPMVARAQTGPLTMRFQSAWPAKDLLHEYAQDYGKLVNDMSGGDLRIEMLPAGAVVPAFGLLDAVSKGALDGGHGALAYSSVKNRALALWGSGPAFGMDANMLLAWHKWGGGQELLEKIYSAIGANVVSFPYAPLYTQPLGWFKAPLTKWEDFKGLKFRTAGLAVDMYALMGADVTSLPGAEIVAAIESGALDAAEFNNLSSDRALGLPGVAKVCMLQSYHQNAEQLEITFNKTRYQALPAKLRSIAASAADAASQNAMWKAIDRNSQDYVTLRVQDKVHFYKTPTAILQKQLDVFDEVTAKLQGDNPLFKEVLESQRRFAERALNWEQDVVVDRKRAYAHYFGPKAVPKKT
jgi:TRAP-type mannitol/chloroaromatic compound transport system substrate-binding protein